MSEDDIAHLRGLEYSKSLDDAIERVSSGTADAGFLRAPRRSSRCARWRRRASRCPQVDLLLPQGPNRPRVQSAGVKIYTRKGDDGTTGLWYGGRGWRSTLAPEAYGSVDEAASALGPARGRRARRRALRRHRAPSERAVRGRGAELATAPEAAGRLEPGVSKVTAEMAERLEADIDRYMDRVDLPPKFVLPGGTELSARLDVARAAAGRAERRVTLLKEAGSSQTTRCSRLEPARRALRHGALRRRAQPELFEGRG